MVSCKHVNLPLKWKAIKMALKKGQETTKQLLAIHVDAVRKIYNDGNQAGEEQ